MMFKRLRTRIVVFCTAVLGAVQLLAFVLVNAANTTNAHQKIDAELLTGERVFERVLSQNRDRLTQAAGLLSSDYAFREAIASNDVPTVMSALKNHGARIKADTMMLVSLDGHIIADTLTEGDGRRPFIFPALLDDARAHRTSSSLEILGDKAYQLVVVPVLAPAPIAWVVLGFVVDDSVARDLRQLTSLDVSFMTTDTNGREHLLASTLNRARSEELLQQQDALTRDDRVGRIGSGSNEEQFKVIQMQQQHGTTTVFAVLQRSVADATALFDRLRKTLLALGLGSVLLSLIGSALIALNITRPVNRLAAAAARIQGGDYSTPVEVHRKDEIGLLANGFDQMREGIFHREQEILRLAYEDSLTGLPNRALFDKWLTEAIDDARAKSRTLGVLVMDLDRFKFVNDTLGHDAGDHVLREVAFRLNQLALVQGTIARLGGDEFAILLVNATADGALMQAQEIVRALESPIQYQEQALDVGTSIGVAMFPDHGDNASTLMSNSDIAMYEAKRNKSGYALYNQALNTHQQQHLSLLGELRRAVEHNELVLFYQPKVVLATDEIAEVEALLRWNHPTRGRVPPGDFIPFAEQTGYIKVLTRWVLQAAIEQCGKWLERGMAMRVSINISTRDLLSRDLPQTVTALLDRHNVPANLLCLEITESGFMEDPHVARAMLDQLHALGVSLSIDDYGTGYSSLSYVAQLPVDELKIDRSFVAPLGKNLATATIVKSTIELGHNLGLKVVAEGVEDAEVLQMLKDLGCDKVQGYFVTRPLDVAALETWLRDSRYRARAFGTSRNAATGKFRVA
jgi:diguanylate cyclase